MSRTSNTCPFDLDTRIQSAQKYGTCISHMPVLSYRPKMDDEWWVGKNDCSPLTNWVSSDACIEYQSSRTHTSTSVALGGSLAKDLGENVIVSSLTMHCGFWYIRLRVNVLFIWSELCFMWMLCCHELWRCFLCVFCPICTHGRANYQHNSCQQHMLLFCRLAY